MQRTTPTLALLLALAILTVPAAAEDTIGLLPHAFFGTLLDADGTAPPVGTIVVASVRGTNAGSVTTATAGQYGDPAWDVADQLILQGPSLVTGDPVTFYIDGVRATETASFEAGGVTRLNLTATALLPKERPKESTTEPVSPKAGQNTTVTGTATGTSVTLTTTVDLTDETVSFTAFEVPPDDQQIPSSLAPVGRYAEITSTITNDQIESVTIRIYYTDAEVAAAGIDEAQIRVYWWNPAAGVWEQLPGGVDTVQNVAWGETDHFSTFALLSVTATPVTPTPGGGGGSSKGGGGAGPIGTPTQAPVPYEREGVVPTDSTGALTESIAITAADGIAMITVPMGVVALDSNGDPLTTISIDPLPIGEIPAAPAGATFAFMETAYDCRPDGATFSTAIPLRFTIAEEDWTAMVAADLTPIVRWWNRETGAWEEVPATVNQGTRTVTARITHFSVYALLFTEAAGAVPTTAATGVPTTAPAETGAE
ncbi:hypothetical protein FGU65_15415, partial [Methanoculleus sp. FWC-SCC1]|nr:hypothetical protein [Methanoculleus sp. FWC-SCC1]